jgi:hypothetical protein
MAARCPNTSLPMGTCVWCVACRFLSLCTDNQVRVEAPNDVSPLPATVTPPPSPPLSVMSLSLKTVVNPKTHTHEVRARRGTATLHPHTRVGQAWAV